MLGQGGFGRTYLAQDSHRFNEPCVLKEFDPTTQGTKHAQKAEELFAREAGVLYQLHHLQIPQFRELFRMPMGSGELLFLVQDYVAGKTYQELLEERRNRGLAFSEAEVMELLQQLLPVLEYIHRSGIIHRDISPDNIILRDRDQKPVLIDFGVVKSAVNQFAQQPSSATFVGKPGYAPVEQLQKGKAEPCSDLYALAVTIVVLLTGREPQSLFDPVNLVWRWQDYARVSPDLARILDRMLNARPSDRYASANEVLSRLASAAQPLPAPRSAVAAPAPLSAPTSPTATQKTIAVGRRGQATVALQTRTTSPDPRPWTDSIFDVPYALIKGVYGAIRSIFKMTFGLVRFTFTSLMKLIVWLLIGLTAIAGIAWAVQQALPQITSSLPKLPTFELPGQSSGRPSNEQQRGQSLIERAQSLGIDFEDLVRQTNEQFYRRYPDRRSRPLSDGQSDKKLRDEWHRIANDILDRRAKERGQNQKQVAEF
jgi:serine/threonine-protein kinase